MRIAPLDNKFTVLSILGFLISATYIYSSVSETWAFTFMVVFGFMFVASMWSAVKAPVEELEASKPIRK